MQHSKFLISTSVLILFLLIAGFTYSNKKTNSNSISLEEKSLPGAGILAFGPDNILFVGDSKAGMIHAFATEGEALENPVPYNFLNFDLAVAKLLDSNPRDIIIQDMKVHPSSQVTYVSVKKGHAPEAPSFIIIAKPMSTALQIMDVSKAKKGAVAIKEKASDELVFWRDIPASSLNITDMDYHEGFLYVAGLTNGEFASTLRKIAYPFKGEQNATAGIEIYHAIHTQNETRAPIRSMLITNLDGVPSLLASYTCTPLVSIPLSEIKGGNKVVGNTIAELGYGNTPIDMISYMAQEPDGSFDEKLLVTHKQRSGSLISMKDVASASKGKGLTGKTGLSGAPEGLPIAPMPTSAFMHIDNQNQMLITVLKRDIETGGIHLVSAIKGVFLRLSEFISEYDFPDYQYGEGQERTKQFHDMIKPMEGYPELASEKKKK